MKRMRMLPLLMLLTVALLGLMMQSASAATFNIVRGESTEIQVDYGPYGCYWSVGDSSVLRIDETSEALVFMGSGSVHRYYAKVTGLKTGSSSLDLHNSIGTIVGTCTMVVTSPITSFTISKTSLVMAVGTESDLSVAIVPSDPDIPGVSWASSDPSVVSVDTNGHIAALAAGSADVTVSSADGIHSAQCAVRVVKPTESITVDASSISLTSRTQAVQITAAAYPEDATDRGLTYTSSNTDAATVNADGLVSAHHNGDATITVASKDGFTTTGVSVHVSGLSESISISQTSLEFTRTGQTSQLNATVSPADALIQNVAWKSTNESVATVSAGGLVTAVSAGTANVYAYNEDGIQSAVCSVLVRPMHTIRFIRWEIISGSIYNSCEVFAQTTVEHGTNFTLPAPQRKGWNFAGWYLNFSSGLFSDPVSGSITVTNDIVLNAQFTPIYPTGISLTNVFLSHGIDYAMIDISGVFTPEWVAPIRCAVYSSNESVARPIAAYAGYPYIQATGAGGKPIVSYSMDVVGTGTVTFTAATESGLYGGSKTITIDKDSLLGYYILNPTKPVITVQANSSQEIAIHYPVYSGAVSYDIYGYDSNGDFIYGQNVNNISQGTSLHNSGLVPGMTYTYKMRVNYGPTEWTAWSDSVSVTVPLTPTPTPPPAPIPVTGLTMNRSQASLSLPGSCQLSVAIQPENASDKQITWASSNASVASVDANGLVTANQPGVATISAKSTSGVMAYCSISVTAVPVTGIALSAKKLNVVITQGESLGKQVVLSAAVLPANASNTSVTWMSSNGNVAKVSQNGVVTCTGYGKATIIAIANGNSSKVATCALTVSLVRVSRVTLSARKLNIVIGGGEALGKQAVLGASVIPATATINSMTWTTSNPAVAVVDQNGVITSTGFGKATITATANDGSKKKASCTVTVSPVRVSSVVMSAKAQTIVIGSGEALGKQIVLSASVAPASATNSRLQWSSSNPAVAIVDQNGVVTSVGYGKATIIAAACDGSKKKAACKILVIASPASR